MSSNPTWGELSLPCVERFHRLRFLDVFIFNLRLSRRQGSEVDLREAEKVFHRAGFDVYVQRNLPYGNLFYSKE